MYRSAELLTRTAAVALLAAVFSTQLASQSPGMVSGTVSGANNTAIPNARVRLLGSRLTAVTGAAGEFHVAGVPTGQDTLEVLVLGYSPKRMPVDITVGATFRVRVVLVPVILETVNVSAHAASSRGMGGFEERRAKGVGRFFTREEIVRMQARQVTDVLRRVPGMRIQTGSGAFGGGSLTAHSGRSVGTTSARVCP
ncbi:MAG TPA: TonB-dependent receptor, partial [Gemmatimonadaceae bacterium]|nr:TonB-dependent receptor [Gemmatimonadaceae bacterium]